MKPICIGLVVAALAAPAHAESVYAVHPIEGYTCMRLNLTEKQALDFSGAALVWILTAPETHAPHGTWAAAVVLVRTPKHLVNGYLEVLQETGKPGWIEADKVKTLRSERALRAVSHVQWKNWPGLIGKTTDE